MDVQTAKRQIDRLMERIDLTKPRLAHFLLETKNGIYWRETEYLTWSGFCEKNVALSTSSIYKYLKTAELMNHYNYSMIECLDIIEDIGWARFQLGLTKLEKRISVKKFIKRFHDANLNERIVYQEHDTELVEFSFQIPDQYAQLLTNELIVRGMRVQNHNRTNASAAMVQLIKDVLEEA